MAPIKIITVDKARELERRADEAGVSYAEMMENAGRGVALAISRRLDVRDKTILILIGPGNNGGDGLVTARYLGRMRANAVCYIWKRKVEGDANYRRVADDGLKVVWASEDGGYAELRRLCTAADVIVDALLGVGVDRPIEGSLRQLIDIVLEVQAARRPPGGQVDATTLGATAPGPWIVAVDCPTGLDCNTGALDPAALPAHLTVTFDHPKVGLLRFPGAEAVGDLAVADIGIPPHLADDVWLEMASAEAVRSSLPARPRSAHKGTFGRALIVAGSVNYVGAAVLAGQAATRVGTGLVTMALPLPIQAAVAAHLAEATYLLLPHDLGVIASGAESVIRNAMADYESVLLGPGLTQEKETVAFVQALLGGERIERKGRIGFLSSTVSEETERLRLPPLVVDADGLNALSGLDAWWSALPAGTIVTPHPGEMARLMGGGVTAKEIQADREGVARRMASSWGTVVVLKGAFTVVAAPDGRVTVLPFANAGLATAGSGDVLAGAIVGLRAQGMGPYEAAVAAAYVHGLAGELARKELGDMGMVAGDVALRLPLALKRIREGA